jgi:hypothetical protein
MSAWIVTHRSFRNMSSLRTEGLHARHEGFTTYLTSNHELQQAGRTFDIAREVHHATAKQGRGARQPRRRPIGDAPHE